MNLMTWLLRLLLGTGEPEPANEAETQPNDQMETRVKLTTKAASLSPSQREAVLAAWRKDPRAPQVVRGLHAPNHHTLPQPGLLVLQRRGLVNVVTYQDLHRVSISAVTLNQTGIDVARELDQADGR